MQLRDVFSTLSNSVSFIIDIWQGPKYLLDTAATLKLQTVVIVNT